MKVKLSLITQKAQNMIETINLSTFEMVGNYVLVKIDPDYDVKILDGPDGKKVELKLISFGEQEANHYSITGTVLKRPKEVFFFDKNTSLSQKEFGSAVFASNQVDADFDVQGGDKIYYNYNVHLSAEKEYRILESEEHGALMLIPIYSLFGYERNGEIIPLNGYVFFERDKEQSEFKTESGLWAVQDMNGYELNSATVISSSSTVRAYLDSDNSSKDTYQSGDRIIIDKRFGYKMAYDLHAGEIKNVEVVLQKNILCKIDQLKSA